VDNDLQAIQQLVNQLYSCISFGVDTPPNWERLRHLFLGEGQLIRNHARGPEAFTLKSFQKWVEKARSDGLQSFFVLVTDSSTHQLGTLAHRASHYHATVGGPNGGVIEGVNSIQLMKCEGEWKVLSLAWEVPTA